MSEAVTILAIVAAPTASIIAGIASLRYAAEREDRRIRERRSVDAQNETVAVLDRSALALADGLTDFNRRRASVGDPEETGPAFYERVREVRQLQPRIAIRLGPDNEVTKAFDAARDQLEAMSRFAYVAQGDLDRDQARNLIDALQDAQRQFLQAAYEYRTSQASLGNGKRSWWPPSRFLRGSKATVVTVNTPAAAEFDNTARAGG